MSKLHILPQKTEKLFGKYYENSTQKWLPIENIQNGIVLLKDGRYIKVIEVLPVNFYLKSEVEQENIIYYFASYLKIAPDNLQIRVMTQRADIEGYSCLKRHTNAAAKRCSACEKYAAQKHFAHYCEGRSKI